MNYFANARVTALAATGDPLGLRRRGKAIRDATIAAIDVHLATLAESVPEEEIGRVERNLATTAGTCAVMGTASTMACLVEALGQALVIKSKGHGSSLTPAGEQLLRLVHDMRQRAQDAAQREIAPLDEELRHLLALGRPSLRLACSHDILLADCVSEALLDGWELRFMGSQKALDALESGTVNLAGFHLPEDVPDIVAFESLFADPRYFVHPLMRREQGLVVAAGNPLDIRGIDDLVRPEVRFINRQRGAGTRVWLDHLLGSRGLDPAAVRGYGREEFTHFAVAAAVAAGAADVAFAQRAATVGLALDFIPIGCETYFICGSCHLGDDARVRALFDTVARRLAGKVGYAAAGPPTGKRRQA
jgi:molybdate-binding protein